MVEISERKKGDGVSICIIHVAAVSFAATHVPEITLAIQSLLKTGFCNATQAEVLVITCNGARATEIEFYSFWPRFLSPVNYKRIFTPEFQAFGKDWKFLRAREIPTQRTGSAAADGPPCSECATK